MLGERFTLIGELGRGGMATVWLAEDRVRGARVALKILHAHLVGDTSTRERLRREVMTAGLIRHEGALLAQELHELDGHLALSMPYHPGRTLAERVAAEGPIGGTALRAIGARLADVLAAAHRAGVLHRDITPANVMIDDEGVATLTDFGLARLEQWQSTRHTGALGTAGHAAPEVYDGERADPRSDLYSLGTVLYYAASGRAPFAGPNAAAVLKRQLSGEVEPLASLRPELPDDLCAIIHALLRLSPEERPQGAAEVAEALRGRVVAAPPRARRASPKDDPPPPPPPPQTSVTFEPAPLALPEGRFELELRHSSQASRRQARRNARAGKTSARYAAEAINKVVVQLGLPKLPEEWTAESTELTDAEHLARGVALRAGLPVDALLVSPVLDQRRFRLVSGVSEDTVDNLAALAESRGFTTKKRRRADDEDGRVNRVMRSLPNLIGPMWVLWAIAVGLTFGSAMAALPVMILITVVVSVTASNAGRNADKVPLAYGRDLRAHVTPDRLPELLANRPQVRVERVIDAAPAVAPAPQNVAAPVVAPPAPKTRGGQLLARVEESLAALELAIGQAELPTPAEADLRRTVVELRAEAADLAAEADRLDGRLKELRPEAIAQDLAQIEARIRRLETMEQAGQRPDPTERPELLAAKADREATLEEHARWESKLTATAARLLDIGGAARKARQELLGEQDRVSAAGEALRRLEDEVRAARRAEGESDRLRRARGAQRV